MSAFDRMTDERDAALRRIAEIEAERDKLAEMVIQDADQDTDNALYWAIEIAARKP